MSIFPLGRLFWKFFAFFFLAQLLTNVGIGVGIWLEHGGQIPRPPQEYAQSRQPPPHLAPPGLKQLPQQEASQPPPPIDRPSFPDNRQFPSPKPPYLHIAVGAFFSLVFAALLAIYVSRPIRRLRQALIAGAQGDLSSNVTKAMGNRKDELADLGRDFDRMARHLAQLMESQRSLLYDVSHELRSPLARLQAIVGLARQQPDSLHEILERLEHESAKMDRLLSELLTLSRLESGMVEPRAEIFDLVELLEDVVDDAGPEAQQAGFTIDLEANVTALVCGAPEMLHRLFDNLVRNAMKHAAAGKWIGIKTALNLPIDGSAPTISITVSDRGPGVKESELAELFTPFFRGRNTLHASGQTIGHGLGLAIARQIAETHQGTIRAANRLDGGLAITVTLPVATQPSTADK